MIWFVISHLIRSYTVCHSVYDFWQLSLILTTDIAILTLLLLNTTCPVLANCADPDQLASEEANWSGSALFVIKYANFYQKTQIK